MNTTATRPLRTTQPIPIKTVKKEAGKKFWHIKGKELVSDPFELGI